jgi:hypothetical protein
MHLNWHLIWLWLWFELGMFTYWLKRAYYLVTGPNPIANSYTQFVRRCWIPLLVRGFLESLVFWAMFTPGALDKGLAYLGWTNWSAGISMVTQFAPFAAAFGHALDSIADIAISKIPWLRDFLPQMPGPIPTEAPSAAQAKAFPAS